MLTREWLYTSVTRASQGVVLFHDKPALLRCVSRQMLKGRDAEEKARTLMEKCKADREWAIPRLHTPRQAGVTPKQLDVLQHMGVAPPLQ
jgi:hypothetical protein